jgi:antitoxin CptB
MKQDAHFNRLRWQCRRGMLELDLLLLEFLERHYAELDEANREDFAALLEYPDQTLQRWLFSAQSQDEVDPRVWEIIKLIRTGGPGVWKDPLNGSS